MKEIDKMIIKILLLVCEELSKYSEKISSLDLAVLRNDIKNGLDKNE